ncbi:metalloprotease [Panaeolus papilionaceus]|nr:metalloprotease [Panaeolus papilionaceus]
MFRPLLVGFFCVAQLSVGALASIQGSRPGCGIATPSHSERLRIEKDFNTRRKALRKDQKSKQVEVEVVFHIISEDESREGGNIPDEMIQQQVVVLNQGYKGSGLSFSLLKTTRSVNPDWYQKVYPDNYESKDMVQRLRDGGPETLNIFTVGFKNPPPNSPSLLGYATFPWDYEKKPDLDGVVLHVETLPGGKLAPYNEGQTATHEVGHWVGLWHTFQTDDNTNKCDHGDGDFVKDTPLQNGPSSGCPVGRDSCPDDDGLDPIHNFMDYSDDSCLTEFTKGQIIRFKDQMATYRYLW